MRFEGKLAMVTGAASGIGLRTARAFAREGAELALVDLNEAGVEAVAREIRDGGGTATAYAADLSRVVRIRELFGARPRRRAGQYRRDLPHRPAARSDGGPLGRGPGAQPARRLLLLPGGHRDHARAGRRCDREHCVRRRLSAAGGHGRLLHLESRPAGNDARAGAAHRPQGRPHQHRRPGAHRHRGQPGDGLGG
ncbi:MAG: SDR family NAD(P)-dependent oxidoreductase [Proteobacteria bacterium]|nr:SDR family NAD(P)-dependent oxidoreductase [Pseudomonadota bacterium]